MYTLIIAIIIGIAAGTISSISLEAGRGWSIFWGIIATIVTHLAVNLILRRPIKKRTDAIQGIILDGQKKLNSKVRVWQQKPMGGIKHMQKLLEREQNIFLQKALEQSETLKPFYNWSILLKQQISTMQMQFHFQLKNSEKVDELLPKCLYMEPMSVAIRMTRMYKNNDEGLDKFFEKKIKKFKHEKGILLYALYSWILVKQERIEEAHNLLTKAKEICYDDTITANWEHLANARANRFSNAGIGDEWYALGLETPKTKVKRQKMKPGRRPF